MSDVRWQVWSTLTAQCENDHGDARPKAAKSSESEGDVQLQSYV